MGTLSRRRFLQSLAACSCSSVALGAFPFSELSSAYAANGNGTKLLIINMSGGWDGLSVLQPSSGDLYTTFAGMRPTLKSDPSQLLPVDSQYGFHPNLTTLKAIHDEGSLMSILNVGYLNMSRSHKDSEVAFARGVTNRYSPQASGFISRLGAQNGWTALQGISIGGADPAFEGAAYRGIQVWGLSSFDYQGDGSASWTEDKERVDMLRNVSQGWQLDSSKAAQREVVSAVDVAVSSSDTLQQAVANATFPTAYPNTYFGRALRDADILFSTAGLGTQLAYVRRGGLDTHSAQGTFLPPILTDLNNALAVLISNMKSKGLWSSLIVAIISEFGRTNEENDSAGTDHGGALPIFLLGGTVNGGLIGSTNPSDLTSNEWLPMKINVVDVYRQIVTRMGYDSDAIFEPATSSEVNGIFT